MLDVIAPGAAVFEPEEVDVLTAACGLAMKKIGSESFDDPETRTEVAKLVHNLGRSRLRHRRRLRDAADAATLAEEAADLLGYLRGTPDLDVVPDGVKPSTRAVPIFPADLRAPPTTTLLPRTSEMPARKQASKPKRVRANVGRPGQNSRPRKSP